MKSQNGLSVNSNNNNNHSTFKFLTKTYCVPEVKTLSRALEGSSGPRTNIVVSVGRHATMRTKLRGKKRNWFSLAPYNKDKKEKKKERARYNRGS